MLESYVVYNLVLIFGAGFAFFAHWAEEKELRKFFYFLSFLVVWLSAGLRYNVGTDYPNYVYIFEHLSEYQIGILEPWYYLLNLVIAELGLSVQWVFIVTSFIITLSIYVTATNYHRGWFILCFILVFYFPSLNLVRQITALSIMVYGVHYLLQGKDRIFFLSLIAAIGFHYSVLLFLPLFFLRNIKVSPIILNILFVFTVVLLLEVNIIAFIFENSWFGNTKYATYVGSQFSKESELRSGLGVILQVIMYVLFLLFFRIVKKQPRVAIVGLLSIGYVGCMILTLNSYIFVRVLVVFMVSSLFIVGYISNSYSKLKQPLLVTIMIANVVLFEHTIGIALFSLESGLGISPYQSILGFL